MQKKYNIKICNNIEKIILYIKFFDIFINLSF